MTKVVWQDHGVTSGEERAAPPPVAVYSRLRIAIVLQLLIGATVAAQLAPVPSHDARRS